MLGVEGIEVYLSGVGDDTTELQFIVSSSEKEQEISVNVESMALLLLAVELLKASITEELHNCLVIKIKNKPRNKHETNIILSLTRDEII